MKIKNRYNLIPIILNYLEFNEQSKFFDISSYNIL